MKLCKIEDLKGTEILARAVSTPDYVELLSAGTLLKQEYIDKLKELNIKEVYIKPNEEYLEQVEILRNEVEETVKAQVKTIIEKHTYTHNQELVALSQAAESIITNILDEEEVVEKVFDIKERSSDIYEHSISITSLSILTAIKMGLSHEVIHDIGVSCLLHDIGLRYLTVNYNNVEPENMNSAEKAEYMKHPIYGYSILKNEWWISEESKKMILYHHECMDGFGYPLHATKLATECKIINICDTFDEMICGIGRNRVKVYEAVEYLKNFRGIKFDSDIVDVFLDFTAVYPAGTHVITNEGEEGIVVKQNREFPDRPVLRMIKTKDGSEIPGNVIKDLVLVNNVFIEKVLD